MFSLISLIWLEYGNSYIEDLNKIYLKYTIAGNTKTCKSIHQKILLSQLFKKYKKKLFI